MTLVVPAGFPPPVLPADNPLTPAKVELGRRLFYDVRLSGNQTQSCASCHRQELAFTDGLAQAVGSTGERHPRSAMSLVNLAWVPRLTWANPLLARLSHQALLPMFGEAPVELGMAGREDELLARLGADEVYVAGFSEAFPADAAPISVENITLALEAFQLTIISGNSAFDRFMAGDGAAMSASSQRGLALFMSERLECFHCHGGVLFTDSINHQNLPESQVAFHNTGLYNVDFEGGYPAGGHGLYELTGKPADMGRFRAPTLRNIAKTAPYMHDGSVPTLDAVLEHYAAGGRTIFEGPNTGVGFENPYKSDFVRGFVLTTQEREDLLAFLESLTDEDFLRDPRYADPFASP